MLYSRQVFRARAHVPSTIFSEDTGKRLDSSPQPEEEGVVVRKDGDDIEVLEQVDSNQVDDGLIFEFRRHVNAMRFRCADLP